MAVAEAVVPSKRPDDSLISGGMTSSVVPEESLDRKPPSVNNDSSERTASVLDKAPSPKSTGVQTSGVPEVDHKEGALRTAFFGSD